MMGLSGFLWGDPDRRFFFVNFVIPPRFTEVTVCDS